MFIRFIILPCFALMTALISSTALAAEALKGRVEVNHRYGQERSITMTEFWVPIAQDENGVFYGDLRMMGDNADNREGNIGFGYRKIQNLGNIKGIVGGHSWIDRRKTARGSKFHQLTVGAEWLGESVDVLANGYIPLSSKRTIDVPNANPQGPALVGTGIVVDTDGKIVEEPQHGFDIELGFELGEYSDFIKDNTDSFRVYGGGYYFDGDNSQRVTGWRTRLATDVTEDIQLGGRFQRDDERGSQGFLEATIRFPFGQKQSYRHEGLRARLDDAPERDIDIVTGERVIDTGDRVSVINQATGTAQEVLHVDNTAAGGGDGSAENPFNTLAAAQGAASAHTVIYVNRGDGTTAGQNAGISLDKTGQQLIGSGTNFIYDGGKFTTANGASPTGLLIKASGAAPVITNGAGNGIDVTADNITVAGVTVDGASSDGIVVEADGGAASAQNVIIKDVTAQNNRFGIYVHGANGGSVSASVQGSVATTNSQHGIAIYDDTNATFEADLGGGSLGSTGNNVLAGNTLEDLAVELDGGILQAQNNWWGQASGADTDDPSVGIAPQIYYGAPINDGLAGHWTFDSEWTTNTTAYDRSANGNDGTLQGGLSLANQVVGQHGEALNFDGVDDRVSIGISSNYIPALNSPITILTVHNPDTISAGATAQRLVSIRENSGNTSLTISTGANNFIFYSTPNTGPESLNNTVISTGVFSSAAISYNSAAITGYVNAVADSNVQIATLTAGGGTQDSFIGAYFGTTSNYDGKIDDVRIYDRALGASEISELYRMDTSSSVNTSGFLTSAP